jgi:hypothetical protein
MWLSVDPGLHGCGVARWEGENLIDAGFAAPSISDSLTLEGWIGTAKAVFGGSEAPGLVVVELMRVYAGGAARPSDLLALQAVASAVAALGAERGARAVGVLASDWKRQVPREVMGARVAKEVERRGWTSRCRMPSRATQRNDVHHAIGLGLYALREGLAVS